MSKTNLVLTIGLGLALTAPATAMRGGNGNGADKPKNMRVRGLLVREAGSVEDDAKGRIDLATKKSDFSLRVQGQKLTPGSTVDFAIVDDLDAEQTFASVVLGDDEGSAVVFLKSKHGDAMPLDAAAGADLAGRRLTLRDSATGELLLASVVPTLEKVTGQKKVRGRDALTNDAPEVDDNAKGRITAQWRAKDGRGRLVIVAQRLADGDQVDFLVADDLGTLQVVGSATANADGVARYRVFNDHGAPLPFDEMDIRDLMGRDVRVDVNGQPQLSGAVPGTP